MSFLPYRQSTVSSSSSTISSSSSSSKLPAWVATQQKAFTRWANTYLQSQDIPPLVNLAPDLSNGVRLIQLLEIIGAESLGRYYLNPKLRVQKAENVNTALEFIKHRGVMVYNIGAEDIIDCNLKLVLGLLWVLILRFTISDINEEGLSAKEGLLLWCQRKTAGYEGVDIRDFSSSWTNGLAFCALLDRHRPDLIDFYELDPSNHRQNMETAFRIASEQIGIPQLLDVEDICDIPKPDERSIMTYVAYWFHAFSALDKIETAGRRLEKFVEVTGSALEMQHSYERRVRALLAAIRAKQESWDAAVFTDVYTDVKKLRSLFTDYKRTTKRTWITEKSELGSLLGNIRTKLATYGLNEYEPPEGLRISDLEAAWRDLLSSEACHAKKINSKLGEIKELLRTRFADTANEFAQSLDTVSMRIGELDGELERQLVGITDLSDQIKPLDGLLIELRELDRQCVEANVEENDHTVYSYDELEYELGLAKQSVVKKLAFIENQIVARSMTNLTPIQLEEFESVFRFFDKGHRNALLESEFSGALASLGLVYSEEEMHDVFQIASGLASLSINTSSSSSKDNNNNNKNNSISSSSQESDKQQQHNDGAESIASTVFSRSSSSSSYTTVSSSNSSHLSPDPNNNNTLHRKQNSSSSLHSTTSTLATSSSNTAATTTTTTSFNQHQQHKKSNSRTSVSSEDQSSVSFEQFIKFMVEVTEDQQTADQVLQSFVDIANGKSYVTELDLQNSLVPDSMIEVLIKSMPVHEDYIDKSKEEDDEGEEGKNDSNDEKEKDEEGKGFDYVKYMKQLTTGGTGRKNVKLLL